MSKRILLVIGGLATGGSERQLLYLVEALRGQEHEVTVAVWNFRDTDVYVAPIRATGATVVSIEKRGRGNKVFALGRLLRASKFDVVQSFSFYLNVGVALAAVGTGTLAIGSVRSTLALAATESGPVLGRVSARWPAVQVYNNAFAAAEARRRLWWRPRWIAIVANHIDVERFPDVEVPRNRTIAAIGSLTPVKRWERLIALAARLRDRGIEASVVIAGEGPQRPFLEAEIARCGLQDRVTLLGYVPDVQRVLAGCAFLMHVSSSEGSPNAIIEALAAGRAVIATDVGDVPRLVCDGETGFVVPFESDDVLYERAALLLTRYDLSVAMGRCARRLARERFGSASLAHETLEAYRLGGNR